MEPECFDEEPDKKLIRKVRQYPVLYHPNHRNYKDNTVKENIWLHIAVSLDKSLFYCKTKWRTIRDSYRRTKINGEHNEMLSFLDASFKERGTQTSFEELEEEENSDTPETTDVHDTEGDENSDTPETTDVHVHDTEGEETSESRPPKKKRPKSFEELEEEENCDTPETTDVHDTEGEETSESRPPKKKRPKKAKEKIREEIKKKREERGPISRDIITAQQSVGTPEHPIETFFRSMAGTVMYFPPQLIAETRMKVCKIVSSVELRALSEQSSGTTSTTSCPLFPLGQRISFKQPEHVDGLGAPSSSSHHWTPLPSSSLPSSDDSSLM